VHVVGHSYGAAIALQLAVDAPHSVHTLTLLEAPSMVVPGAQQFAEAMGPIGERFASGDKKGATDDFLAAMGGAGYHEPLDHLLPGAFEQAVADSDALFTVELPALVEWGLSQADATRIDERSGNAADSRDTPHQGRGGTARTSSTSRPIGLTP
jgi:pimeloyl-ACP methyl ester carboxylesterase